MSADSKLNEVKDSLKEKYAGIISHMSHVDLERFK